MSAPAPSATAQPAVLILGATSIVARYAAAHFAQSGYRLVLAGRNAEELDRIARDLRLRHHAVVDTARFDAADTAAHADFFAAVNARVPAGVDGVLVAFGELGEHQRAVHDSAHVLEIIATNFLGAASILTIAALHLEGRGRGFLAAISSVAGDRGRQSNYIYGSAKGGLSLFLQGLRNRLARSGVRVCTIKLGFVDTQMTFGLPRMFLVTDPARAGAQIVRAIERRRDVAYVPGFWRYIMLLIRLIPEPLFKQLKL